MFWARCHKAISECVFPPPKPVLRRITVPGFLVRKSAEHKLRQLSELLRGKRVAEENFGVFVDSGGLALDQISKVGSKYRVLEVPFENLLPRLTGIQNSHAITP